MKIAITGANGYLGSSLTSALSKSHDVLALTRKTVHKSLFELDKSHLPGIDCLIHAAGVADSRADPERLIRGNVELSAHVARVCAEAGVPRVFNLSSIKACGEGNVGATVSDAPGSAYGKSKLEAEYAFEQAVTGSSTRVKHIRLPLVYSKLATNNFSRLVALSRSKFPIPVAAFSSNRSYCSVRNLISYCVAELESQNSQGIVYVGDAEPIRLGELVSALAAVQGHRLVEMPLPEALLRLVVSAVKPNVKSQLFEDAIVSVASTEAWQPLTTAEYLRQEFAEY